MIIRTTFIVLLTIHDVGFAVYVRFYDPDNRTGFMGHLCGALAGLTVGLFLLDNRSTICLELSSKSHENMFSSESREIAL